VSYITVNAVTVGRRGEEYPNVPHLVVFNASRTKHR